MKSLFAQEPQDRGSHVTHLGLRTDDHEEPCFRKNRKDPSTHPPLHLRTK